MQQGLKNTAKFGSKLFFDLLWVEYTTNPGLLAESSVSFVKVIEQPGTPSVEVGVIIFSGGTYRSRIDHRPATKARANFHSRYQHPAPRQLTPITARAVRAALGMRGAISARCVSEKVWVPSSTVITPWVIVGESIDLLLSCCRTQRSQHAPRDAPERKLSPHIWGNAGRKRSHLWWDLLPL